MYGREAEFDHIIREFRPTAPEWTPIEAAPPTPSTHQERESEQHKKPGKKSPDWWKRSGLGDFLRVPNLLHRSGIAAKIGPTATAFYLALLDQANRYSSCGFTVSDRKHSANTGISTRTMGELRKVLVEAGLIRFRIEPGHSPRYELLAVEAKEVPYQHRAIPKKKPRGRSAPKDKSGKSEVPKPSEPEMDDWEVPQPLRGLPAKYARPYAKFA